MSATNRGGTRIALDAYFTPFAVARLIVDQLPIESHHRVLEPSAGGGSFVYALCQRSDYVMGCDVNGAAIGLHACYRAVVADFLTAPFTFDERERFDYCVGNPPYNNAEAHIRKALSVADNVVFLLRAAMLESRKRRDLWRDHPARHVWMLEQRPSFTGGATDSCMYAAIHWDRNYSGPTTLSWLEAP